MVTMNQQEAVELNNTGVTLLQNGYLFRAFEVLTHASKYLMHTDKMSHLWHLKFNSLTHSQGNQRLCHCCNYEWVDCSAAFVQRDDDNRTKYANEASIPFLCLHAVRISVNNDEFNNALEKCACGIDWAICYK